MSLSFVYLGHCIDAPGLHPTSEKVAAIQQASTPQNYTELQAYLRLLNYYSKFMPNLLAELAPLYKLLQKSTPRYWVPMKIELLSNQKNYFYPHSFLFIF